MVSITLNSALFSKISNVHIFRTMHRILMIFFIKMYIISHLTNVEYFWDRRIFYRSYENTQRVHTLNIKFRPQIAGLKALKIAHETKY